jgi:hypothetical protein
MSDHKPNSENQAQQSTFSDAPVSRLEEAIEWAKKGAEAATGSTDVLRIVRPAAGSNDLRLPIRDDDHLRAVNG